MAQKKGKGRVVTGTQLEIVAGKVLDVSLAIEHAYASSTSS